MEIKEILKLAINNKASDIFIIAGSKCILKVQQKFIEIGEKNLTPQDTARYIQSLYSFAPYNSYANFRASGEDDFSFSVSQIGRFRVNVYRQRNSEAAMLRVIDFKLPDPKEIGIPQTVLDVANRRKGMVLISGPAGNGKSTTLACLIDQINKTRAGHIITIEDPIEFFHQHKKCLISQREISHDTQNYLTALKSALRQDPEVILLGEMRDKETVSATLTAAETGHLIFSTLHTIGAVNTIDRIVDMFEGQQDQIRLQLPRILEVIVSEQLLPGVDGKLVPAFEILNLTPAVRSQIRENKIHQIENTMYACRKQGMQLMDDSIYDLYIQNKITKDTAIQYALYPERMIKRLA